jgi:three-Cys-motif partner protein
MDTTTSLLKEPEAKWGGKWTTEKLDAFSKYVSAYLTIMSKQKQWKTIYFDGFAGSGNRNKIKKSTLYTQLELSIEDDHVYKGAAERILTLPNELSFDFHYFIDLHEESLKKLEEKLKPLQETKKNQFQYKAGDCNSYLKDLSNALKSKPNELAALVLLDPFGMQIDWKSIASLKDTRSDIWILIPTGVIVNRLLNKNGELNHIEKLKSFFGTTEEEIVTYFYRKKNQATLFGDEEIIQKISDPIEKIAELYTLRLKTIWSNVTEKPLRLLNSKGVPIYHFVFASNNPTGVKIAKDIISTKK